MTKKTLALLLTLVMTFALLPVHVLATEFSDMPDNWSTTALEHAVSNGLLNGENGQIRPDDNLTRAQMAAIINRAFGSTEKADLSGYSDVHEYKWYYDDMAKAVQMGIFTGYNNKLSPDNSITRQEVFVVLARAFKITAGDPAVLSDFEDTGAISSWAVDAVSALIEAGYVNGNNGKINPLSYITRAEFAQLMYNMAKVYISTEGTYPSISSGNVIINTPDVTLKDVNVTGDLIIGDGVGDGNVTLVNVNVSGRMVIRGGGLHTIKILGTSNLQHIIIARVDGQVRVYTEDGTVVGEVIVDGKDDVLIEGSVSAVTILANDVTVTAKNAMIDDAVIEGDNSKLIVESDSSIDTLTVESANTEIEVNGQITDVIVNEESAAISGSGRVETVQANADNVSVTTENTLVTAAQGTTGIIAGTQDVSEGTTQNTTPDSIGTGTPGAASNGYSVSIDQAAINASNKTAFSFTFSSAEVGADYTYSIDDTNGGTAAVTGNGTISTATDQITGIDVSGLDDDTLTLTVTITGKTDQTDSVVKDTLVPSGYNISIDQSTVNSANETAFSFTFSSAETGTNYTYSIDDTNGGTAPVTGSGTIATATDQISGIDVSGLDDDTLTLTVYLTDSCGNQGSDTTDTVTKDVTAPSGYTVSIDQGAINTTNDTALSFTFAGAEVGTDYAYTISDGSGTVTGSGTISTATDQISSLDVSSLGDGTLNLSVILTDIAGNAGTAATDNVTKETTAPGGYTVSIDQESINAANDTALSFTFASAEVGTDYAYTISDGSGTVTGSGTISTATDQISSIDVSGLGDGTLNLSVTLTDAAGNVGSAATDSVTKDATAPSGYSVSIDQSAVTAANEGSVSLTFASAEVGAYYTYSIDDTNGGTAAVTGSGTISTATDQISGIDVSGLDDDTLTLTVYLSDSNGNQGGNATDTVVKDTVIPGGYTVSIDQGAINAANDTALSFTFASAEVGTDYAYTISDGSGTVTGSGTISTATDQISNINVSGLGDGTLNLSVTLTDAAGNVGSAGTDIVTKDATPPSGYSVSFDQSSVIPSNKTSISFTFAAAEVGTNYTYSIDDTNVGTSAVTGSGTISSATDQISGIDVSGLDDDTLTLTVYLTDSYGNQGSNTNDTVVKDTVSPSGYSVNIDQIAVNSTTETTMSFTFSSAEAGANYSYSIDDTNGSTAAVTGSGTIATATDQISGIDVSGLDDGTLTLTVILTDAVGNVGSAATDTVTKDVVAPSYTSGYPTVLTIGTTSFTIRQYFSESSSRSYIIIVADGSAAPSVAEVLAGVSSGGGSPIMHTVALAPNVGFSGLSEGTAYDVYFVAQDTAGNYQSSVTKLDVTTTSVIPATLTVSVTGSAAGSYYEIGTYSKITDDYNSTGRPLYRLVNGYGTFELYWDTGSNGWVINYSDWGIVLHANSNTAISPPKTGWSATDNPANNTQATISY